MSIHSNSFPLAVLFGQYEPDEKKIIFVGRQGYFHWMWLPELFTQILMLCNGYNTVKEIAKQLNQKTHLVVHMLKQAENSGIVNEANKLYSQFHYDTRNPAAFANNASHTSLKRNQANKEFILC
jgi:hypothetical protein